MANKDFKVKNGLDISTPLPVTMGGTGQTSTTNTLNSLLPSQAGNSAKVLQTDGNNTSWVTLPTGYSIGNTSSRPGSPVNGQIYSNTETGFMEIYNSTYGWEQVGVVASTVTGVTATNSPSGRAYNNGAASISFTPGTVLGRSYTVTSSPGSYTATGTTSPITITGLQSSIQYTYTVTATNNYGTSSASSASSGVTATTVPQAPTIGTATNTVNISYGSNPSASVTFTAGATGGSAITQYTATSSPGNITSTGASSPITVSNLTSGTAYTFTVAATNANGTSAASSATSSINASTVPQAPTIGVFTDGGTGTTGTLSFTAGSSGNSTITSYKYSTDGVNYTTASGTTSPLSLTNLSAGTFTFYLKAVNANGDSAASSGVSGTVLSPVVGIYEPIASITIPAGGLNSVTFSNIPQTYQNLQVRTYVQTYHATSNDSENFLCVVNDDTSGNYTRHYLFTSGSGLITGGLTGRTTVNIGAVARSPSNMFSVNNIDILDYANTNKYKTFKTLSGHDVNSGPSYIWLESALWKNTNAITSLKFSTSGGDFQQYSKIDLYGVKG